MELAKAAGIAQRIATAAVRAAVSDAQHTWPKMIDELPTPQGMKEVILDRLKTLPCASTLMVFSIENKKNDESVPLTEPTVQVATLSLRRAAETGRDEPLPTRRSPPSKDRS